MEHRSSTRARHLTLFCAVPFISVHARCLLSNSAILVRRLLGSPPLSLPLWVPLQCPLGYMSIWSPQRMADPAPSSLSYLLLYRTLPCLSPKLLVADFSRPSNPQDVPQALIDERLQLLVQSLSQPPSFRTMQEHHLHI